MTAKQEEVYRLLIPPECLTPSTIARRLGKTRQAVDKLIRQLRRRGFINREYVPAINGGVLTGYGANLRYRMHAIELNITIIQPSDKYWRKLRSGDVMIDGNRCKLYRKKIKVYCGRSFFGVNPDAAVAASVHYVNRLLRRMEDELGCILCKEKYHNVRIAKAHIADTVNEVAELILRDGDSLQVRGEDGKVWLLVDGSWDFTEMETVHPETFHPDANTVHRYFNDWKNNPNMSLQSEMEERLERLEGRVFGNQQTRSEWQRQLRDWL